jgi:hypothetical protein
MYRSIVVIKQYNDVKIPTEIYMHLLVKYLEIYRS